jgi:hypothetical protein
MKLCIDIILYIMLLFWYFRMDIFCKFIWSHKLRFIHQVLINSWKCACIVLTTCVQPLLGGGEYGINFIFHLILLFYRWGFYSIVRNFTPFFFDNWLKFFNGIVLTWRYLNWVSAYDTRTEPLCRSTLIRIVSIPYLNLWRSHRAKMWALYHTSQLT